ncbi:hypothetical protein [uncultured Tateyamaria sp.]|uniref:hypothetical protein n=1 Tax=uncultured Tateyamaria sp. TaxID=455651 RepID=UPI0026367ADE|nr:hypothetical protein [uncultured Tateyamaria sp.]
MKKEEIRSRLTAVLTEWLESKVGQTSADRQLVEVAVQKLADVAPLFSQEETDILIDCMMEMIDIDTPLAESVVDYLNENTR